MVMALDQNLEDCIWGRYNWNDYIKQLITERTDNSELLVRIDLVKEGIEKQIRKAVEEHHPRLVEQASALQNLDRVHAAIGREMAHLHKASEEMSARYQCAFDKLRKQTQSLEQLYALKRILHAGSRCEQLIAKIASISELVKRSELVCELEAIVAETPNMRDIMRLREVILVTIPHIIKNARDDTISHLKLSLKTLNAQLVSSSVSALRNLSCYDLVISQILDEKSKHIDSLFLQLSVKSDNVAKLLPEVTNQVQYILEQFALLEPKVLRSCSECIAKIVSQRVPENASYAARVLHLMCKILSMHSGECMQPIENALRPLRRAVLAQALSRMSNVVQSAFDEPNMDATNAQQIITMIKDELAMVEWDANLSNEMETNVAKVFQILTQKIEMRLLIDEKTLQLGERLSSAQITNYNLIAVAQSLCEVWPQFGRPLMLLIQQTRERILAGARSTVATILASMHNEPLGRPSPYVKELCDYLGVLRMHAVWFAHRRDGAELLATFIDHVSVMLVLNASLIRPWESEFASLIVADFKRIMTSGIEPLIVEQGGAHDNCTSTMSISNLNNWKMAFDMSAHELSQSENLPFWLIVHILISRCDQTLCSPHESVNWTVADYLIWFVEHDQVEHRNFLSSLINSYTASILTSGRTEYVEHYPLIMDVLKQSVNVD